MTTGTIIVFLWAINLLLFRDDDISALLIGATILTALEFGAIKLIDYLISMF